MIQFKKYGNKDKTSNATPPWLVKQMQLTAIFDLYHNLINTFYYVVSAQEQKKALWANV